MRWLLTLALLALAAWPAAAEENDAEKLFRDVQQKIRTAKTLQIHFDATITDADAKKGTIKGTLILGEGDKLRAESEGKLFGEEYKFTVVCDGTDMKSFGSTKAPGGLKQDINETEESPKGAGAYLRGSLPRDGFFLSFLNMVRRGELVPDVVKMSDFKLAGEEKIGERNTQVIQYKVKAKGKSVRWVLSMKVWLDAKTNLPVKLAMTGGESDISAITETYSEFTIDAKVDAKLFELPKGKGKVSEPLPPEVVAAWQKAGGTFGWMEVGNLAGRFTQPRLGLVTGYGFVPAFRFDRVKDGALGKLPQPPQRFGLQLDSVDVSDETLKELAGLNTLQALSLGGTHVTDVGLKQLAGLKSLQMLNLSGTAVSDQGLKELSGLTALRALSFRHNTRITDAGLKELGGLKALRVLDVSGAPISDAGLKHLAGLDALEELTLDSTPLSGAGFKELAGLRSLRELQLYNAGVTDVGLKGVAALKSLQRLYLDATSVTDAGLKELAGLASLEDLGLSRMELTGVGLSELAVLKSLWRLNLARTKVTDAGLNGVGGLTALRELDLGRTLVTDAGLKELAGLKALESLSLRETNVTDRGLGELAGLTSLRTLDLQGTRVTDAGLADLRKKWPKLSVGR